MARVAARGGGGRATSALPPPVFVMVDGAPAAGEGVDAIDAHAQARPRESELGITLECLHAEGRAFAGARLRMRIDRVDALAGGGRAILDYKSGRRVSADWYGERPTHPQLLAYSEALGEEVVALATVSVNAREVRFDGIARSPGLLPAVRAVRAAGATDAWAEQQRAWRAILTGLIRGFLAGEAAVDPRPGACDYCHVIDICRISERAGGS